MAERDQQLLDLYARHAADLIERLRFEQALKEADRRKDEFLATLAHELRTPLAPIRSAVDLLKSKDWPDADLALGRDVIGRQAGQMARLLDDLLDVSRITRGKLELRRGRIALATVVETWGSAPRPAGSSLVINDDGTFLGSVSGGCVEGAVVTEALDVIASGKPKMLEFGVADETAWNVGLSCGGTIRVFVEKVS